MNKKLTRTFVRTKETMDKYIDFFEKIKKGEAISEFDTNLIEKSIKTFNHWFIIENKFPYDVFAETSHMLLPKRKVAFDWGLLTKNELDEYWEIRKNYISKTYDVIYENQPKAQSIPKWFHLHLLILKREE